VETRRASFTHGMPSQTPTVQSRARRTGVCLAGFARFCDASADVRLLVQAGPYCAKRVAQLHPQILSIARYLSRRPNTTVAAVGRWLQRVRVWPLLNAAVFGANVVAVSVPGRIDGKYAETKVSSHAGSLTAPDSGPI
jgi:hypothetical protein